MLRRNALVLGVICLVCSWAGFGSATPSYTVTALSINVTAADVNNAGQIVGDLLYSGNDTHAFLYTNGNINDLGTLPGGYSSNAARINATGQIVGSSTIVSGRTHAFQYVGGTMTDLGTLGGHTSYAYDINDKGQVVGEAWTASIQNTFHAFLYANGAMTDLGTLGGALSCANSINNNGQVVGWSRNAADKGHACLFDNGTVTDLGTLSGYSYSQANAINDIGQVVGWSGDNVYRAFLYSSGSMIDIGTLGSAGNGQGTFANDINNSGQVVGSSFIPTSAYGGIDHAFLYANGAMRDLNDLIDPASGWTLNMASAINDSGWIVGWGSQGAFLLTPTPEPSMIVLLLSGLASLLFMAWRRRKRIQ